MLKGLTLIAAAAALVACNTPPPASRLPNAQAAIDRMRATASCGNAIQADAKLDLFADDKRVRTNLLFIAARPARLRMDGIAPVVGRIFTLSTDGAQFQVSDLRNNQFLYGPATASNIARVTHIPMPIHPLVSLLNGRAPVLRHDAVGLAPPTIAWGDGYYVIKISGNQDANEEVHLVPHPDDWNKPWSEQRLRVLDVSVMQRGVLLYHVELDSHEKAPMTSAANGNAACDEVCKALGQTPTAPSGPMCEAELPRRIHVEIPAFKTDASMRYDKVEWNPPIDAQTFTQQQAAGLTATPVN